MKMLKAMCVVSIVLSSMALATEPKSSTYSARSVTDTSALLRGGVVDDSGVGCLGQFRYWEAGTDTVMTTGWRDSSDDPNDDTQLHSGNIAAARVTGLQPGTTYMFVFEVKNGFGTDEDGTPNQFTTLAAGEVPDPPDVFVPEPEDPRPEGAPKSSTYAARQVTDTSALLRGGVVDDGGEGCKCQFRYWEAGSSTVMLTGWHDRTPMDPNNDALFSYGNISTARITGLKPETTYMFVLELMNSSGADEDGTPRQFTTLAPLMLSPSAGGVTTLGVGKCLYPSGTVIEIQAASDDNCEFIAWTGTAVINNNVATPNAATTNVVVIGSQTLKAVFRSTLGTIHVDANTPNDPDEDGSAANPYDSIQEAIDVAQAGTTIIVRAGTYVETLDFLGKPLTVINAGMGPFPVIDANYQGPVVSFVSGEQDDSVLQGFVLTHGLDKLGGAIFCVAGSPTIANCSIVDNWTTNPAGRTVYCIGGKLNLIDCVAANNHIGETPE